ncbi:head-tail adaptor protein [Bosea sp. LjRoot90]|uniref:head-tail adaptor protein n=1 Tax=Bosea sp. LjRoot90 TaxID=3342342 RepID=UPI003ECF57AA
MLSAGQRNHRVRFERRVPGGDDGYGNPLPETWTPHATVWAGFRPKFGREQLEAGRLESSMQGVLTVLSFAATRAIAADSRVVFLAGPFKDKACQIRSIVPAPDNREIEFLLEEGKAL